MARPRSIPDTAASSVIDALGGIAAVAAMTSRKYSAVHHWHAKGRLPANTFVTIQNELRRRGITAPASLWGMVEPESETNNPRGLTPLRQLAGEWR